jgi:formimidoylglutamate deiminase
MVVFALGRTAIRDVAVGGRMVMQEQRHPLEEEIVAKYRALHAAVWREA